MNTLSTIIGCTLCLTLALPLGAALAQDAHRPAPSAHPRPTAPAAHAVPAAHAAPRAGATALHAATPRPQRGARIEGQVNLNTATAEELMRIPGIGPTKAQAILATRARQPGGRFARLEDVMRARGIGRGTVRRLRDVLVLSGPTTLRAVAATATPAAPPAGTRSRSDDDV